MGLSHRNNRKRHTWKVSLLAIILSMVGLNPAAADENLQLAGYVESIDMKDGIIVVDVRTAGCEGIKTFVFEPKDDLFDRKDIGRKVEFFINSTDCTKKKVYTIKREGDSQ